MQPWARSWFRTAVALVLILPSAATFAQTPELAVIGGSGLPGGTVAARIRLARDGAGAAVGASLDIRFPTDLIEFNPPVTVNCRIAERLAETHQIGGTLVEPGLLGLAVFARELDIAPLGDGDLAACDFHILPDADAATAPLATAFAGLVGARGGELAVIGVPGAIVITVPVPCVGDCNGSETVTIEELIRGVQIVLGNQPVSNCPSLDRSGTGTVSISDMINAVNNTLDGCPTGRP
jgi:hypothetical protein